MIDTDLKEYDKWNELKKRTQLRPNRPRYFPQEGEVWASILGKNIGVEQNGVGNYFSRPVLIIKKFNAQMLWCVPLSSKQKDLDFYYNFADPMGQKVSAILAQLRLISTKRLERKWYTIPYKNLLEIKTKIKSLL